MQPHTIAENLILPACKEIVKSMLGESAEKNVSSLVINEYDWVRNPFAVTSDVISHLGLVEQEQLLELQSLKLKFNELKLF